MERATKGQEEAEQRQRNVRVNDGERGKVTSAQRLGRLRFVKTRRACLNHVKTSGLWATGLERNGTETQTAEVMRGERNKAAETLMIYSLRKYNDLKSERKNDVRMEASNSLSLSCWKAERNNHKYEIKV